MSSRWFAPLLLLAAFLGWATAMLTGTEHWMFASTQIVQNAFLAALKMIIAPLIFFSLISGILQMRNAATLGKLGSTTLFYYLGTSAIAIVIGLSVVFFIHPWTNSPPLQDIPPPPDGLLSNSDGSLLTLFNGLLADMLSNPFAALAQTNILGILTSAILIGLAAAAVLPKDSTWPDLLNQLTQVIYKIAGWVILCLPIGMFAISFQLSHKIEMSTLVSLGQFAGVVVGATLLHGLVVLPMLAWLLTGTRPINLLTQIGQPLLTAFVTSSSAATLPVSIKTAQEKLNVPAPKAAFILPLGATMNMDGTALFEGIAVIFLAYMFNIELTTTSIIVVFFVAMLASAGAPGIPSGSMSGLQVVLIAVGIPLEAIALLLLIERPLDTIRTAVNVEGDLIGSLIVHQFTSPNEGVPS